MFAARDDRIEDGWRNAFTAADLRVMGSDISVRETLEDRR